MASSQSVDSMPIHFYRRCVAVILYNENSSEGNDVLSEYLMPLTNLAPRSHSVI